MSRIEKRSNQSPEYKLKSPMDIYRTEWRLTNAEKSCLSTYSLRNWTINEFLECAQFSEDGDNITVRLWNVDYIVEFQMTEQLIAALRYSLTKERSWRDPINSPPVKLWTSFRHGYLDGKEFSYAIVQQDTKVNKDKRS